jgi:subtilisin family serine protease
MMQVRLAVQFGLFTIVSLAGLTVAGADVNDPFFRSNGTWQQAYDDQWALKRIGFGSADGKTSAWEIETGENNPVIVAVIDSGIDYFHPDLYKTSVWRNTREKENGIDDDENGFIDDLIGWNFVDNDNNPYDQAGHGTHVAGVIAAATGNNLGIAGINRGAKIMPLKVLNFIGRGRSSGISEAIHYAVANGAQIINLSLGGLEISPFEQRAIDYAYEHEVLVVVAAGNSGVDTANFGPAASPHVLTVGATDVNDQHADFSNWGASVDIVAPGIDVLSLRARYTDFAHVADLEDYAPGDWFVGPEAWFYRASGTSFAAPLVTGVASLVLAKNPDLTVEQLMRILTQSARDIDEPGVDQHTGYGLLDARAALTQSPEFFVEVSITGVTVIQGKRGPLLQITGTFNADKPGEAWIEIGEGSTPTKWKKVSKTIKSPVLESGLDDLEVKHFAGASQWTLRLIGEHKNGQQREARFVLDLG